ncbi:MAG TPA: ATP-binding protein, partial [Rhodocyclaceae bacterium]|nr:ATP-binding protein [Rhodocyclaceae bacterium]
ERADLAGERMASMDRKYAALNTAVAQLRVAVTDIQRRNFERQTAAARNVQEYEYVIGLMILVMVAAATVYGHRIARQMQAHAEEEERHLVALSEAEARTRSILDTAADSIVAFDAEGRIETFNKAAERLFGCPACDAIGTDVRGLVAAEGHPFQLLLANSAFAADEPGSFVEVECRRFDGTIFPAEVAAGRMPLIAQRAYVGVIRDMTERRSAERALRAEKDRLQAINEKLEETQNQLLQADKMASIGQLAAGVTHEINNPMGFVGANVAMLQTYVQDLMAVLDAYERFVDPILVEIPDRQVPVLDAKETADLAYLREDLPRLFDETKDGVARVRRIVQDLKEFSHVGATDWHFADLHKGLDSTLNIVWNELKYKVQVVKEYGRLPEVECVSSQINQVFMNLLVNAAHAIEGKGTITLRSGAQDGMAWVEVEDSGSGIPPQHLKRIFEPFFTTKPVGKGTGLGLSLCYGIAKRHGGRIEVTSELGTGSAFRLYLPVRRAVPVAAATDTAEAV